jgi:hypothetical protein
VLSVTKFGPPYGRGGWLNECGAMVDDTDRGKGKHSHIFLSRYHFVHRMCHNV